MKAILSCEHGGNEIPPAWQHLFKGRQDILASHRGFDPGALELASALADQLHLPLYFSTTSRLLVDLNRSPHHPSLFSEFTRGLPAEDRRQIINGHYLPYRHALEDMIRKSIRQGIPVLHISVHSFTPVLNRITRNCDIGLLYDPRRKNEKAFCRQWKTAIKEVAPDLRIRYNYPYLGKSDGLTTHLRQQFHVNYAGIELELNQTLFEESPKKTLITRAMAESLESLIANA